MSVCQARNLGLAGVALCCLVAVSAAQTPLPLEDPLAGLAQELNETRASAPAPEIEPAAEAPVEVEPAEAAPPSAPLGPDPVSPWRAVPLIAPLQAVDVESPPSRFVPPPRAQLSPLALGPVVRAAVGPEPADPPPSDPPPADPQPDPPAPVVSAPPPSALAAAPAEPAPNSAQGPFGAMAEIIGLPRLTLIAALAAMTLMLSLLGGVSAVEVVRKHRMRRRKLNVQPIGMQVASGTYQPPATAAQRRGPNLERLKQSIRDDWPGGAPSRPKTPALNDGDALDRAAELQAALDVAAGPDPAEQAPLPPMPAKETPIAPPLSSAVSRLSSLKQRAALSRPKPAPALAPPPSEAGAVARTVDDELDEVLRLLEVPAIPSEKAQQPTTAASVLRRARALPPPEPVEEAYEPRAAQPVG